MPATRLNEDGTPDKRLTRWANESPEDRRKRMTAMHHARSRAARERRITELIEAAPPLTDEQRARLAVLLNGGQDHAAAS
jgi:hypothetical protein